MPDETIVNQTHYRLSKDVKGHFLHHTRCFSPDDIWIVYDHRNTDSGLSASGGISVINVATGEDQLLYETKNQSEYGPGVGAASFSPVKNQVVFIHGLRNCSKLAPYAFNRRSAALINLDTKKLELPDARNIKAPYTTGALRGGTHAHLWDEKGEWISFTYDDYVMDQLSAVKNKKLFKRTVGIMIPDFQVKLPEELCDYENHNGTMFSFIAANTTPEPVSGSDEIDTAFDETWVGKNGYVKPDGRIQKRALAVQGNVRDETGKTKTEIFIIDLPERFNLSDFEGTKGSENTPPLPPKNIQQRRITFTQHGIRGPRHWLRSLPDGSKILFLNKDEDGITQLFSIAVNGGIPRQVTRNKHSIEGPFNLSPDGKLAAYICNNCVVVSSVHNGNSLIIPPPEGIHSNATGAVVWSNSGNKLAYNRLVFERETESVQIFIIQFITAD